MATGMASGNGEMAMLMPLIMGIQGGSGGAQEETLEALLAAVAPESSTAQLTAAQHSACQGDGAAQVLMLCGVSITTDGHIVRSSDPANTAIACAFAQMAPMALAFGGSNRKRSFAAMDDGDSGDDSDEEAEEAEEVALARQLDFATYKSQLAACMERLEWDSDRPIRRQTTTVPVWDYNRHMEIIKGGGSIFAVKWDETHGSLTQIGATNSITCTCLSVAAFTSCRVMLIATMNIELAVETVSKLLVTAGRTGPFSGLIDVCFLKDLSGTQLADKLRGFASRLLVLVDSSDDRGMGRLLKVVEQAARIFPGTAGIHFLIDEIDDTIRTMPDAGRDKMRECELLRNAICTHTSVVKVHGCTATPEAVYEYFKKKEVTAPALGFSDEWVEGTVCAVADKSLYVGQGDLKPVDGIGFLKPLGSTVNEWDQAKVGEYMVGIVEDLAMVKSSASYRFVEHFLDDPRPNATLLVSLTDMVNGSADASSSMQEIIDTVRDRPTKQPTMKELAYITLHRAAERGQVIDILTINGELIDTKYQRTSLTMPLGSFQKVIASSTCDALDACSGKVIVIFGSSACRGRSFVSGTRVPTHLLMMNGKRSVENAVDQSFGRMTGCHKDKLCDHPPYVLCMESDFQVLGTSDTHGMRKQYRAQTGLSMALDLYERYGLSEEDVPALYPITAIDEKILRSMLDYNSKKYVTAWASIMRMWQLVIALRNGHNPAKCNEEIQKIVTRKNVLTNSPMPVTLSMLQRLEKAIHAAWKVHGAKQQFVLYAQRAKLTNTCGYKVGAMRSLVKGGRNNIEKTINAISSGDTKKTDSAVLQHGREKTDPLHWSAAMQKLQEKLGPHWPRLCTIVADRYLTSFATAEPVFDNGQVQPPQEFIVINARREQGA